MIRTRIVKNKAGVDSSVFYDTSTGGVVTNLRAVSISVVPGAVITVVYKDKIPYIYLPHKDMMLVSLKDAIEIYELQISKVS